MSMHFSVFVTSPHALSKQEGPMQTRLSGIACMILSIKDLLPRLYIKIFASSLEFMYRSTFAKLPWPRRTGSPLPSSSSFRSGELQGTLSEPLIFRLRAPFMLLCLIWCSLCQISKPAAIRPTRRAVPTAMPACPEASWHTAESHGSVISSGSCLYPCQHDDFCSALGV